MSCIGLVDGMAKYLAQSLHGLQITWCYFVGILSNLALFGVIKRSRDPTLNLRDTLATNSVKLQFARAGCLVLSLSCLFFSLKFLSLADATVISFMAPLFVVALAGPILGERATWQRWAAVCVGLIGALLIVRPGTDIFDWAAILPLIGAVFFALFHVLTRFIGRSDGAVTTLTYTFLVGTLVLSPTMPFVWTPMSSAELVVAVLSGGLGLLAHGSLVRSLTLADASVLAPINYVRLIWALGIGYFIFAEVPDVMTIVGGTIIVFSGLYVVYSAAKRAPTPT
jgi:drug/metabolite transporter (DMT)-like permease